jgi:uncharacterized protein YkwD
MIHEPLKVSGGASEKESMAFPADKALVLLVVMAVFVVGSQAMSRLELFGMEIPEDATVTACDGRLVEVSGSQAELLKLHNEERAEHGVAPLCWRTELANSARSHSEDMMERGFFSHDTPEVISPSDRTRSHGYPSAMVGENIHLRQISGVSESNVRDLEGAVEGWMDSPGHRRNILDPRLSEIGVGVAIGKHGGDLHTTGAYTVNFGTLE